MKLLDNEYDKDQKVLLTGITPSGTPHIGNYIGAIQTMVKLINIYKTKSYCFVADYHSLIKLDNPQLRKEYIYNTAATWLAFGLNPKNTVFYSQSNVPEILELNWILNTVTAKSLLHRAHAYKDAVNKNYIRTGNMIDHKICMGLYNYPILMAADIILFDANIVPIGKDQIQHIEIARAIIHKFNNIYSQKILSLPQAFIKNTALVFGTDGRKMSKSQGNIIDLFSTPTILKKYIMKIITNSQSSTESKKPEKCILFSLYKNFSSSIEASKFIEFYRTGISWKEAKQILFERINKTLMKARKKYCYYMQNPKIIQSYLELGTIKARQKARYSLDKIKDSVGL
jgi:tryptophanyl-tRNA synthetase